MNHDRISRPAGTEAPKFTLASTVGELVTRSDVRREKSVFVISSPLAVTSVRISELCAVSEDSDDFVAADVQSHTMQIDALL